MQHSVFYSWQSDLPSGTNRGFIEDALLAAAKAIAGDEGLEIEPVIDRDVQGVGGAPDISKTIFRKIDKAAIFVADVSIIGKTEGGRPTPNPNVLVELGYALHVLGPERIIQVMNREYGGPDELPFDLRMRLTIPYSATKGETEGRAAEKKMLQGALREQITTILRALPTHIEEAQPSKPEMLKSMLTDPAARIKLDDFLSSETRALISATTNEQFPLYGEEPNKETFTVRVEKYRTLLSDLDSEVEVLARWSTEDQISLLERIFVQLAEAVKREDGRAYRVYEGMRWYPVYELLYVAGMAAIAANRYDILNRIFSIKYTDSPRGTDEQFTLLRRALMSITDTHDAFKLMEGRERQYVPRNEYMHDTLSKQLEHLVPGGFERLFDRFEVLLALACADLEGGWGPIGRFGWKHHRPFSSPFTQLVDEAKEAGSNWPPLKGGMFGGSIEHFLEIAESFKTLIDKRAYY